MRELCVKCMQPKSTCFCEFVSPFETQFKFVILIHPIEARRRIATGRMAHLCLKNSVLIRDHDYTNNERLNEIFKNPNYYPVILFPGANAQDLTNLSASERQNCFPKNKEVVVLVIDGTWHTARKTLHLSKNLHAIPKICFTPSRPSRFRVREQPGEKCFSTIEAIHELIELIEVGESKKHEGLLFVFDKMVEKQLEFIEKSSYQTRHVRIIKKRGLGGVIRTKPLLLDEKTRKESFREREE